MQLAHTAAVAARARGSADTQVQLVARLWPSIAFSPQCPCTPHNLPRPGCLQVSSKIGVIETLIDKVDKIILGGGMIFTFYKARGINVGSSLVEEDKLELAKSLEAAAKKKVSLAPVVREALVAGSMHCHAQVWAAERAVASMEAQQVQRGHVVPSQ